MASRYLGLVVVPGQYIVKMEVEEFLSQSGASRPYSIPVGTTTRGSVSVEVSTSTAVGSASELSPRQPLGVSSSVVARAGPLAVSSVVTDDDTAVPVTIRTAPAPALESPVLGTAAVGEGDDMEGIR